MKQINVKLTLLLLSAIVTTVRIVAQNNTDSSHKTKTVVAGAEYKRSSLHQSLWGKNYRKEWSTPVRVPVLYLDDAKRGLKPDEAGGGHQTKSLHLKTKDDKEYALRSVNKKLGKVPTRQLIKRRLQKQDCLICFWVIGTGMKTNGNGVHGRLEIEKYISRFHLTETRHFQNMAGYFLTLPWVQVA